MMRRGAPAPAWASLLLLASAATAAPDFQELKVEIKKHATPDGGFTPLNDKGEIEWRAESRTSPADKLVIRFEYRAEGEKFFRATYAPSTYPNSGKADIRHFFRPAGRKYTVRVIVRDPAARAEAQDTSPEFFFPDPTARPGDPKPPEPRPADPVAVEPKPVGKPADPASGTAAPRLEGISEGGRYPAGGTLTIQWTSPDAAVREATFEILRDGKLHASMILDAPSKRITLPDVEGRYQARVVARDAAGGMAASGAVTFDVTPAVAEVRIVTRPVVEAGRSTDVLLEPRAVLGASREIRLEVEDRGRWVRVAAVKDAVTPFSPPAAAGDYSIRAVAVLTDGREIVSNVARFRVEAPRAEASIRLLNFRGGEVYPGGSGRIIAVQSSSGTARLRVELSSEGGRDGTWKEIARDQLVEVSGGILWRQLPAVTGTRFRLRVSHAEEGESRSADQSQSDFSIDSSSPFAAVEGPEEGEIPVRLAIRATPSLSPIRAYTLYVSVDRGRTWSEEKSYDAAGAVRFSPAQPGDYALYVVARSEAGLAGEPPTPGTRPQALLRARGKQAPGAAPDAPLALRTPMPEAIRGGAPFELVWASREEKGRVTLWLVAPGRRDAIVKDQPPSGRFAWPVPKEDLAGCQIVVERDGQSATSSKFDIESTPPVILETDVRPRK